MTKKNDFIRYIEYSTELYNLLCNLYINEQTLIINIL